MFEIYKGRKWTYLIPAGLFWGAVPVLLYVLIKDIIENGFTASIIMGPICIGMLLLFGYLFFSMFLVDPYANIKKLQSVNSSLVSRMEADFDSGRNVCPHIWRGREFYFFEGSLNFLVVPVGGIQSFSIRKGYSKSIGPHYDCCVVSEYGKAEFAVSFIHADADCLLAVARDMAIESGIALDLQWMKNGK